ncbi:sterile alpha motif domain-containing protein 15-like [Dendronephthya gigantea]|uniref:sterile alpha motif domain-containing protein 15-like n=1 Tax=Dendronephthya gigantea TaxID=151771 RepID=UPI0010696D9A|nr:sterile alpha motif domain-containing protein 15-like [Dendronephthya gigantea]
MAAENNNNENDLEKKFSTSFDNEGIPLCLEWSAEDVAEWIEYLGFPQYKRCFSDNLVNGRKLITIHASSLPRIGITDFEDIKLIAKKVREITGLEEPDWTRSITLQHRERLGLFLEKRALTGAERDAETFAELHRFLDTMEAHAPAKRVVYPDIKKTDSKKRAEPVAKA